MPMSPSAIRTIPCPSCFARSTYGWCDECMGTGRLMAESAIRGYKSHEKHEMEKRVILGLLLLVVAALLTALIALGGCAGRIANARGWPTGVGIKGPTAARIPHRKL